VDREDLGTLRSLPQVIVELLSPRVTGQPDLGHPRPHADDLAVGLEHPPAQDRLARGSWHLEADEGYRRVVPVCDRPGVVDRWASLEHPGWRDHDGRLFQYPLPHPPPSDEPHPLRCLAEELYAVDELLHLEVERRQLLRHPVHVDLVLEVVGPEDHRDLLGTGDREGRDEGRASVLHGSLQLLHQRPLKLLPRSVVLPSVRRFRYHHVEASRGDLGALHEPRPDCVEVAGVEERLVRVQNHLSAPRYVTGIDQLDLDVLDPDRFVEVDPLSLPEGLPDLHLTEEEAVSVELQHVAQQILRLTVGGLGGYESRAGADEQHGYGP